MSHPATSAPEDDADTVARRAITVSAILFCAGLVQEAVRSQIFFRLAGSAASDTAALTFNLVWGIAFGLAFIAVIYLRAVAPSRRVPATAVAAVVLVCDISPAVWVLVREWAGVEATGPPPPFWMLAAWVVPLLVVLAWGLSRRRNPQWLIGLAPALIAVVVAHFVNQSLVSTFGFGFFGSLLWAVTWWGGVGVGCLACWGFDVLAGASPRRVGPAVMTPGAAMPTNGMAIAALVSAFVFAPLGIVLGHMSLSQIKRTGEDGKALAIAGLAIGYTVVAIGLLFLAIAVVAIISLDSTSWH